MPKKPSDSTEELNIVLPKPTKDFSERPKTYSLEQLTQLASKQGKEPSNYGVDHVARVSYEIPNTIIPKIPAQTETSSIIQKVDVQSLMAKLIAGLQANFRIRSLEQIQSGNTLIISEDQRKRLVQLFRLHELDSSNKTLLRHAKNFIIKRLGLDLDFPKTLDYLFLFAENFDNIFLNKKKGSMIFETMTIDEFYNTFETENISLNKESFFEFTIMDTSYRQTWAVSHFTVNETKNNELISKLGIEKNGKTTHTIEEMKNYADRLAKLKNSFTSIDKQMSGIMPMLSLVSGRPNSLYEAKYTTAQAIEFILLSPSSRITWIELHTS